MVKSGLEHSHIAGFERSEYEVPRVSPYRLAGHLTMAFATYGVLAWTTMDFLNGGKGAEWSASVMKSAKPQVAKALGTMRNNARFNAALIAVTIISGAFVAGNDAGHAYNDFPFFAGQWIPEEIWDDRLSPSFRNAFENTALVQFDHRCVPPSCPRRVGFGWFGWVGGGVLVGWLVAWTGGRVQHDDVGGSLMCREACVCVCVCVCV
jgi:cytochrome c oxidase assembly protein subunit 15